jgi:hypothetical protein
MISSASATNSIYTCQLRATILALSILRRRARVARRGATNIRGPESLASRIGVDAGGRCRGWRTTKGNNNRRYNLPPEDAKPGHHLRSEYLFSASAITQETVTSKPIISSTVGFRVNPGGKQQALHRDDEFVDHMQAY